VLERERKQPNAEPGQDQFQLNNTVLITKLEEGRAIYLIYYYEK